MYNLKFRHKLESLRNAGGLFQRRSRRRRAGTLN